jgi:hypothetical protein
MRGAVAYFLAALAGCSIEPVEGVDARIVMEDAGPIDPCAAIGGCTGVIDALPFAIASDTHLDGESTWDRYACASETREDGPEHVYAVTVDAVGILGARVTAAEGVDVDVHILSSPDPSACLARGDRSANALVDPGTYYIAVDSWTDASGTIYAGRYDLNVRFLPVPEIDCASAPREIEMYWRECAPGIDCRQDGEAFYLRTPAQGPVVREAHLVVENDAVSGWPTSARDGLEAHYALSESISDYIAQRRDDWAPSGEGGSMWGQGSFGARLPELDEAWYVNMYWRDRPAPGTRMIVRNRANGRAVVAAAGYETGPGDPSRIGGAVDEIHDYLGSDHLEVLEMGFLADEDAPLGPVRCLGP